MNTGSLTSHTVHRDELLVELVLLALLEHLERPRHKGALKPLVQRGRRHDQHLRDALVECEKARQLHT